tara:strand:+ start:285 stop:521 length:237 start_codon:yes stop_codon:yes gene_type:complete
MSDRMSDEEQDKAYGEKCPQCDTTWSKTPRLVGGHWYHCLPCNKKAEDIPPKFKADSEEDSAYEEMIKAYESAGWGVF